MGHVTQYETNGITANNYFATSGNMSYAGAQFTTGTDEDPVTTTIQDMAFIWDNTKANLNSRLDYAKNTYEDFNYDGVQRCTTSVLKDIQTNSTISNLAMSYFDNGNISYKSNAGDYDYTGLRPHALKKVTNFPSDFPVRDQNITYNEFNKVSSIEEDIYRMELTYGTAAERRKVVLKNKNTDAIYSTKYYAEDYEKTVLADNHTRELYYISSPSGLVAINVRNSTSQQDSLYLIFKDHLGSLAIITDANGTVLQRLSYDMWGKRTVTEHATGYDNPIFDRGFTGHEHLDAFNLINMNGRVFDPVLGRFLSPDNYVQGDGSQGFNRYSYCRNNPLKYTDPSGEFITWNLSTSGFSIGFNFTPAGVPLGAGINIGWSDGFSAGVYGEVGYRYGGTGFGSGVTVSQGLDYNFRHSSWSTTTSFSAYASYGHVNAGVNFSESYNFSSKQWTNGWGVGVGVGAGNADAGIGLSVGYGSSGLTVGIGGYINPPKVYKSPISDNYGRLDGECVLRGTEEFSKSYGMNQYDFDYWLDQNGNELGVSGKDVSPLINGTDVFSSDQITSDINGITDAMSNDKRILMGYQLDNGNEHAVMINKAVVWPSGRYRVWFAETSPVRIAPYNSNNLRTFQGAGFWTFYPR